MSLYCGSSHSSTIPSDLAQSMIRTRAKSGQATQTTPPPPHGDSGGIAPPTVLPEKEPFTIPWFIDLTLRHTSRFAIYIRTAPVGLARRCTLVSTVILYTSIALVIAFVTRSQDGTSAANDIPWGKDGVSFSSMVSPAPAVSELARHTVGCAYRTQLQN